MQRGARDLGDEGPDPSYGHGLVDALAALEALRGLHTEVAPVRGVDHDGQQ